MRTILLLLILVLPAACVANSERPSGTENAFYFYDEGMQKRLIDELKNRRFAFRLDETGRIRYSPSQEKTFTAIRDKVLQDSFRPSFSFEQNSYNTELAARLKAAGIPHRVEERNGRVWVRWNESDDERARKIRDQIIDSIGPNPR